VQIVAIWLLALVLTVWASLGADRHQALAWYGAILAGSIALVTVIHLIKASPSGIVKELVYVAGGTYLILGAASIWLLLIRA